MKKQSHIRHTVGIILSLLVLTTLFYTAYALETPKISEKKTVKMSDAMSQLQTSALSSKYNTKLNAPFNQASSGINEDIKLNTGELSVGNVLVSAQGKNGLDFDLSINYASQDASLYAESTADAGGEKIILKGKTLIAYYDSFAANGGYVNTKGVPYSGKLGAQIEIKGKYIENESGNELVFTGRYCYAGSESNILKTTGIRNVKRALSENGADNTFGIGWSIAMPSLKIDGEHIYVTLDSGQTYQADFSKQSGLKDYELTNVNFSQYVGMETPKKVSAYKLSYANGYNLYFDKAGLLIEEEDIYSNRITYDYDDQNNLVKMTDSVGRTIDLEYTKNTVAIKYGDKQSYLVKEELAPDKWVLKQYIDPLGNTVNYSYDLKSASFDIIGADQKAENEVALISKITYENGLTTSYEYEAATKNMGVGTMDYYKATKRYEVESNAGKSEASGAAGSIKNVVTYSYLGEPDGYPNYTKSQSLPESYTYTTRETDELGIIKEYTYNSHHQLVLETTASRDEQGAQTGVAPAGSATVSNTLAGSSSSGSTLSVSTSAGNALAGSPHALAESKYGIPEGFTLREANLTSYYMNLNLPEKVTKLTYGNDGSVNETADYYGYDSRGNLTSYSTPKEDTKESRELYTKTTEYDPAYNIKVREIYKKDLNTTIEAINILDATGRDIIETDIYANGVFQKKSTFSYDAQHNLTAVKSYDTGSSKLLKTVTYAYDEEGLYQTKSMMENVQLGKTKKSNIIAEYQYDRYSGQILNQTDPNGKITAYSYDKLGRVLVATNPDKTTLTYEYDDKNNIITAEDANGEQIKYAYTPIGNLQSISYPNEGITARQKTYDSYNRLITDENANGTKAVYSYDSLSRLKTIAVYDKAGKLMSRKDASYDFASKEAKTNTIYTKVSITQKGRVSTGSTLASAGSTESTSGTLATAGNTGSTSGTLATTGNSNDILATAGADITKNYYYNRYGELEKEGTMTSSGELKETYSYDLAGNVLTYKDPLGQLSTYKYDIFDNLVKTTNPKNQTTAYHYDGLFTVDKVTDANGTNYYYTYNQAGQLLSEKLPYQDQETAESFAEYDNAGNLTRSIDALGQKLDYSYDSMGRLISATQYDEGAKEIKTLYDYDKVGRLITVKKGVTNDGDKAYQKLSYSYNGLGDLLQETDESGNNTYFEYDKEGQLLKQTDRNGIATKFTYDGLGRLTNKINSKDGIENALSYEYNLLGNLVKTIDEVGTTDYTYDELSRVTQEKIIGKADSEGVKAANSTAGSGIVVKKYGYDKLSRVTSFDLYNNTTLEQGIAYRYNELGQLTALREGGSTYSYEYDKVGRLTKELNPVTNVDTSYTYYPSGNVRSIITDRAEKSAFNQISTAPAIEHTEYEYDKLGNVTSKLENNISYAYRYDMLGRLKVASHDNTTEEYSYDKYGNIARLESKVSQPDNSSINIQTTATDYSYDANNRLTAMRYSEGEASYSISTRTDLSYDKEGNLTKKSKWNESKMWGGSRAVSESYSYNGFNQLAEFEKDSGLEQSEKYYYYYNAAGLRAKKVKEDLGAGSGAAGGVLNGAASGVASGLAGGALGTATTNNGATGITALGNSSDFTGIAAQLSAPKAGFTTNYYYNGGKLALETDGAGTTTAKTLQGIHLIKREVMNVQGIGLSQIQSDAAAKASGSAVTAPASSAIDKNGNMTYFFIQNSRGDVIKLLNENGDIIRDYEYAPFGKEADVKTEGYGAGYFTAKWQQEVEDNAIDNPFRFGGEYKDEESGNYYLRARYYDPEIQRFTQEDTYKGNYNDPMSLNGYAFCGNNPVNFVDPSGFKTVKADSKGNAPKSLKVGDVVSTAGNKYFSITSVNKDGTYKSKDVTSSYNSNSSSSNSTSSSGSSGGGSSSASTATVIRNGASLSATIVNGVTKLADGSRPLIGDVIKAPSGNYVMTDKGGVKSLLSADYPMEANVSKWVSFSNTSSNIDPIFAMRLAALAKQYGKKVVISEGLRSTEYQAELRKKLGSQAAKPGTSWHEFGGAVDISSSSSWLKELEGTLPTNNQNILKAFGIYKPNTYGNGWTGKNNKPKPENWHIQPIETLGKFSDSTYKKNLFNAYTN